MVAGNYLATLSVPLFLAVEVAQFLDKTISSKIVQAFFYDCLAFALPI